MVTVLITGANRGIGLELARYYSSRSNHVIAVCRTSSPELDALGVEVQHGVDSTNFAGMGALATAIDPASIDILIANAGMRSVESFEDLDLGRIAHQVAVNAIGPLATVKALSGNLRDGGKVALMSSRVGSLADNQRGGEYGYRMSKAALNMAGVNLAHDLNPRGIGVFLVHPGHVRTGLTGGEGLASTDEAAPQIAALIDRLTLAETGQFYHANGSALPW